MNVNKFHLF